MATLVLKNNSQKALFLHELQGQISDGMWENASPMNHWQVWCCVDVEVDGARQGCIDLGYAPKRGYNFRSKVLLDAVGDRMYALARLARIVGDVEEASVLARAYNEQSGEFEIPEYKGEYWDEQRAALNELNEKYGFENLLVDLGNDKYSWKDMRWDLMEIQKAMKVDLVAETV